MLLEKFEKFTIVELLIVGNITLNTGGFVCSLNTQMCHFASSYKAFQSFLQLKNKMFWKVLKT